MFLKEQQKKAGRRSLQLQHWLESLSIDCTQKLYQRCHSSVFMTTNQGRKKRTSVKVQAFVSVSSFKQMATITLQSMLRHFWNCVDGMKGAICQQITHHATIIPKDRLLFPAIYYILFVYHIIIVTTRSNRQTNNRRTGSELDTIWNDQTHFTKERECLIKLCVSEQPLHIALKSKNYDNRDNKQVAYLRMFYIESYDYGYHTPREKFKLGNNCDHLIGASFMDAKKHLFKVVAFDYQLHIELKWEFRDRDEDVDIVVDQEKIYIYNIYIYIYIYRFRVTTAGC